MKSFEIGRKIIVKSALQRISCPNVLHPNVFAPKCRRPVKLEGSIPLKINEYKMLDYDLTQLMFSFIVENFKAKFFHNNKSSCKKIVEILFSTVHYKNTIENKRL